MTNTTDRFRIAISTNTLSAGGAEKQRVILANELARRGHHVSIYCLQDFGPLRVQVSDLVRLHRRPFHRGVPKGYDFVVTGTTNTETAFAALGRLKAFPGSFQWLMAIHNPIGPGAPPLKWLTKLGLRLSDHLMALTPEHAEALRRNWKVSVDSCVPNGLDLEWASSVRMKRNEITKFEYDIGYIGRISSNHKGLDLLFAAMARPAASALTLAIAGSGPDTGDLKQLATQLGIDSRVAWLGHQEPASFMTRINTLALFSRYEGQPLVLLEAHAAGVPVVASLSAGAEPSSRVAVLNVNDPDMAAVVLSAHSRNQGTGEDSDEMPGSVADMTHNYLKVMSGLRNRKRRLPNSGRGCRGPASEAARTKSETG